MHRDERADSTRPGPTDRRRALAALVNGATALIGGALATLLGAFALRPASASTGDRWVRASTLSDLPAGVPVPRVLSVARSDGWYRARARQTVFLVRDGDDTVKALSATCTHLGCQVSWDAQGKTFLCPCHGGVYDAAGRVVEGPPPRPLDRIDTRVDAGGDSVLVRL